MRKHRDYVENRKKKDKKFAQNYDQEYKDFKIGIMLKQKREEANLTQEELAKKMHTTKSVISRMENHASDIKISTLKKFADALDLVFDFTLTERIHN